MAITLVSVEPRGPRRLRCVFSQQLAAGAFTATSFYAVTNDDALGVSPAVVAALAVPNATNMVELALDANLVTRARYTFTGTAVPAADLSTFTGSEPFGLGGSLGRRTNAEVEAEDAEKLAFGVDVVWTGDDYLETPEGDLARRSGLSVVMAANLRRIESEGLPWNPNYGAKLQSYVNASQATQTTAAGNVVENLLRDDRNKEVKVDPSVDDQRPEEVRLDVSVVLAGNRRPPKITYALNR